MLQLIEPTKTIIVDSTSLVDLYDMEQGGAIIVEESSGGFKLHAVVNQLEPPLKAVVTSGNRYHSSFLLKLIEDLEADYVLADVGYDSKRNRGAVRAIKAEFIITSNPRRGKCKKIKYAVLLKTNRIVIEQFNGNIKANVLKGCWVRSKGLVKKVAMVMAGLISYDAEALRSLIAGEESLKTMNKYWV